MIIAKSAAIPFILASDRRTAAPDSIMDAATALKYGIVHEVADWKIPCGIMTWNIA